jgi:hypothetical protein
MVRVEIARIPHLQGDKHGACGGDRNGADCAARAQRRSQRGGPIAVAADNPRGGAGAARWLAYVTTLPTDDPAARMSVLRTLKSLGCAVLRDGVFLLPDTPAARQGLCSLSEHIARINGSAHLLALTSLDEAQSQQFLGLFDRTQKYAELIKTVDSLKTAFDVSDPVSIMHLLNKQKRDFNIISTLDFFPSEAKERAARALEQAEQAVHARMFPEAPKKTGVLDTTGKLYFQRVWATRKPLWADQLASAWLIRRFIDPEAKLLWLEKNQPCPDSAIGFGYGGAAFCNSRDRVTFEEMLAGFRLDKNAALVRIGALIHALNAGETGVAEAAGVQTLLQGALRRTESEDKLLAETEMTFDLLYEAYFEAPGKAG